MAKYIYSNNNNDTMTFNNVEDVVVSVKGAPYGGQEGFYEYDDNDDITQVKKLSFNAIDINWNSAQVNGTSINTSGDLLIQLQNALNNNVPSVPNDISDNDKGKYFLDANGEWSIPEDKDEKGVETLSDPNNTTYQPDSNGNIQLSKVAFTGLYSDLTGTPTPPPSKNQKVKVGSTTFDADVAVNFVQGNGINIVGNSNDSSITISNSASDTWRPVKVNDTEIGTNEPLNLTNGSNVTIAKGNGGQVKINATDSKYNLTINGQTSGNQNGTSLGSVICPQDTGTLGVREILTSTVVYDPNYPNDVSRSTKQLEWNRIVKNYNYGLPLSFGGEFSITSDPDSVNQTGTYITLSTSVLRSGFTTNRSQNKYAIQSNGGKAYVELPVFNNTYDGLVPKSTSDSAFLKGNGTWVEIPASTLTAAQITAIGNVQNFISHYSYESYKGKSPGNKIWGITDSTSNEPIFDTVEELIINANLKKDFRFINVQNATTNQYSFTVQLVRKYRKSSTDYEIYILNGCIAVVEESGQEKLNYITDTPNCIYLTVKYQGTTNTPSLYTYTVANDQYLTKSDLQFGYDVPNNQMTIDVINDDLLTVVTAAPASDPVQTSEDPNESTEEPNPSDEPTSSEEPTTGEP